LSLIVSLQSAIFSRIRNQKSQIERGSKLDAEFKVLKYWQIKAVIWEAFGDFARESREEATIQPASIITFDLRCQPGEASQASVRSIQGVFLKILALFAIAEGNLRRLVFIPQIAFDHDKGGTVCSRSTNS
jgi:hypothetical protein